ncbi:MAG: hypothetical protein COB38_08505 [Gammaproteobacteria bacterium]|nr:MAG: hypothetical protein COB38_08505 [Gammaproteobacteria bacterium]
MKNLSNMKELSKLMPEWRRAIHQNPETAYEEFDTAKLVAEVLKNYGVEVHQNIAETGVVGVIKSGNSDKAIGLRADMDALNLVENNCFDHRSKVHGKMHGCGHDGHTAMLLGAACYLSKNRNFDGTIYVIFQPAEEAEGGALKMMEEGLFEKFPMDAIFGMHNYPTLDSGHFSICAGPMMSAFGSFECHIKGKGMHSSMPHLGVDPIEIGVEIHRQWKSILYRLVEPIETAVISITQFNSGSAHNVSPETATLKGSTRCFSHETANILKTKMYDVAHQICDMHNAECEFIYDLSYPALVNDKDYSTFAADVAASVVGEGNVNREITPILGSEDFACMLEKCRGAYILIGNGSGEEGGCMVHNPNYDFNDDILDVGASYWIKLANSFLES